MFDELRQFTQSGDFGGFLPGMKQIANVAALPGIVHVRFILPIFIIKYSVLTFISCF